MTGVQTCALPIYAFLADLVHRVGDDLADVVVAVGGEDDDFCAEGLGFGDEGVAVALPAFFFEGVEGEADDGFVFRREGGGGRARRARPLSRAR